ncbi:hypothetical protein CLV43_1209 [Umezawaea tangerina]|uniref:Low temperature requirement A protein (LtrA) n=1 Tax=Umezawaea tangerina TaxID=84725 RepID=A0A2T0SGP9_9PSEU|nr:hypothetical protein CLV43_1209 [Umezawaea tangerina]
MVDSSAQSISPQGPDRQQVAAVSAIVIILEVMTLLSSSPAPHVAAAGLLVLGFRIWLDRAASGS